SVCVHRADGRLNVCASAVPASPRQPCTQLGTQRHAGHRIRGVPTRLRLFRTTPTDPYGDRFVRVRGDLGTSLDDREHGGPARPTRHPSSVPHLPGSRVPGGLDQVHAAPHHEHRRFPMSRSDVLVDADWVEAHLDDDKVVLVEVDEDTSAYDKGHIRGAVKIDWKQDLQDPVRFDFVDKAGFEKLLSTKGIANDDLVILYGGNNNWFAAYAYWYFKLYGHENLRLLDGGRKKWELDSRELVTEVPERAATDYKAKEQDTSIRAFRDEVVEAIGEKSLVDVRSPDEFTGKLLAPAHLPQEAAQIGGHIPTARNVPWAKTANEDGTFKSPEKLRELYTEAGVDLDKDIIAYCRIGERSSHSWFALRELLGLENVKNYDGSWSEYGSLRGVPVEVGEAEAK